MTDQPYIDPNSGAAQQPGGLGVPPQEVVEVEEVVEPDVSTQIQDDPAGQDAVNPDPEASSQEELSERTGEMVTGEGETLVTAEQAAASDDPTFPAEGSSVEEPVEEPVEESDAFDPSEHNVDEVLAYITENPEEKDAILEAERAGRKRKTILDS